VKELIVLIAQGLLYVLALVAAGVWLTRDRRGKVGLAAEAIVGLVIVGIGILWPVTCTATRAHSCTIRTPRRCSRTRPTTDSRPTTAPQLDS
jgi:hypothetical protein